MLERASPLAVRSTPHLSQRPCGALVQFHAWPESSGQMARMLATHCGVPDAPGPGRAVSGPRASLLRVHPQRLWLVADGAGDHAALGADLGAALDLSHARTIIHAADSVAVPLLSRFIAIDLRSHRFTVDEVAITPLHRVSVVLWRRNDGIDLLVPRSFARSTWELLGEAAERLA